MFQFTGGKKHCEKALVEWQQKHPDEGSTETDLTDNRVGLQKTLPELQIEVGLQTPLSNLATEKQEGSQKVLPNLESDEQNGAPDLFHELQNKEGLQEHPSI